MEIRYKKDMNHNYLILESLGGIGYETKMILNNRINGLLKGKCCRFNGCTELYYDITSKQPLSRVYEKRELSAKDVEGIFTAVCNLFEELKRYLLSAENVIFDAELCYCNPENRRPEWIYYVDKDKKEGTGMRNLSEFLIDRVNHGEPYAVDMVYSFYKMVKEETFSAQRLLQIVENYQRKECEETNAKKEWAEEELFASVNDAEEWRETAYHNKISPYAEEKRIKFGVNIKQKIKAFISGKEGFRWIHSENGTACMQKTERQEIRKKEVEKTKYTENIYGEDWETYGLNQSESYNGETVVMGVRNPSKVRHLRSLSKGSDSIISLDKLPYILGKMEECADIVLKDPSISRLHARLFEEDGEIYMQDLNSKNGTYINNLELEANEIVKLKLGDEVIFGNLRYVFE